MVNSRSVIISPGHSYKSQGAVNGQFEEHYFNVYMTELLYHAMREAQVPCDINDPFENNLIKIGASAQGHHIFVELHSNASQMKSVNYSAACIDPRFFTLLSKMVASECATSVARALDIPFYHGKTPGVLERELTVLKAASQTDCPIYFLLEPFFLSAYTDENKLKEDCAKAMAAVANVLVKFIRSGIKDA